MESFPVFFIACGGDDVAHDPSRADHGSKPALLLRICRRRNDLGDRIAELGHADWLIIKSAAYLCLAVASLTLEIERNALYGSPVLLSFFWRHR